MDEDGPSAIRQSAGRLIDMKVDTLIVGGGLSGLAAAEMLDAMGVDYLLLEARARFGGRILTHAHGQAGFDMGPAWFWPGQPRILALIDRLGLQKFDQFAAGSLTSEDAQGRVDRGGGFSSMQGSWRLQGGLAQLTDALADWLPNERKRVNAQVVGLTQTGAGISVRLQSGEAVTAARVVMALPPRIAAGLSFAPQLPDTALSAMQDIPTWMAGQAKAIAIYETPFWRDAGLSGDAISRQGPMVEIHDASPVRGGPNALFGFIGVPPQARQDEERLRQHLIAQFGRLFGPAAMDPAQLLIKDWAFDPFTSTARDQEPLFAHPQYGLRPAFDRLWGGRLMFAGTEVAAEFGGYLEGALEAAEYAVSRLASAGKIASHAT